MSRLAEKKAARRRRGWSPSLVVGAAVTAVFVGMALVSLAWTPYDPTALNILNKLQTPSLAHPLGTDFFGRDVLSQIMAGAQVSIVVALVAVLVGAGIGVPLGRWPPHRARNIDDAVMRSNRIIAFTLITGTAERAESSNSANGPGAPSTPFSRDRDLQNIPGTRPHPIHAGTAMGPD